MAKRNEREIAIERIISKLEEEKAAITRKINNNKYEFKKLAKEQTVLKRQRVELHELIQSVKKKKGSRDGKSKPGKA